MEEVADQFNVTVEHVVDVCRRKLQSINGAKRFVCEQIRQLHDAGLITDSAAADGYALVESLFGTGTVIPAVSPEDGGVAFYWGAQEMAITICAYGDREFWWFVRGIGEQYSGWGDLPVDELRVSVAEFSAEVARRNPNWRETIDENRS